MNPRASPRVDCRDSQSWFCGGQGAAPAFTGAIRAL